MSEPSDDDKRSKNNALTEDGTLNPAPEKVRDPKFQEGGFFDPRDVVQVKYEMLRRVSVEKASVTDVSDAYGVSRPIHNYLVSYCISFSRIRGF